MPILHEFKIKVAEYLSRLNACYTELLKVKSLLLQEIKAFEIFKVSHESKDPFKNKTTAELESDLKELNDQKSQLVRSTTKDSSYTNKLNALSLKASVIEGLS